MLKQSTLCEQNNRGSCLEASIRGCHRSLVTHHTIAVYFQAFRCQLSLTQCQLMCKVLFSRHRSYGTWPVGVPAGPDMPTCTRCTSSGQIMSGRCLWLQELGDGHGQKLNVPAARWPVLHGHTVFPSNAAAYTENNGL